MFDRQIKDVLERIEAQASKKNSRLILLKSGIMYLVYGLDMYLRI